MGNDGTFVLLQSIKKASKTLLDKNSISYSKGDRFAEAQGLNHHWPKGRAIFHNEALDLIVFFNKEDHIEITAQDSNLLSAYTRAINFA